MLIINKKQIDIYFVHIWFSTFFKNISFLFLSFFLLLLDHLDKK